MKSVIFRGAWIAGTALALTLWSSGSASADALFFNSSTAIQTDTLPVPGGTPTVLYSILANDVAYDSGGANLYWGEGEIVRRGPVAGGSSSFVAQAVGTQVHVIALDPVGGMVYWASYSGANKIWRAPMAGGAATLVASPSSLRAIAIDPRVGKRKLYYATGPFIFESPLDGTPSFTQLANSFSGEISGMDVDPCANQFVLIGQDQVHPGPVTPWIQSARLADAGNQKTLLSGYASMGCTNPIDDAAKVRVDWNHQKIYWTSHDCSINPQIHSAGRSGASPAVIETISSTQQWIRGLQLQVPSACPDYYSMLGGGSQMLVGQMPIPLQSALTPMGGPIGTATMFPPLLIPFNKSNLVKQTAGPDPKQLIVAQGAFKRAAPGPQVLGIAKLNPKVFQIRTNLAITAPGFGTATLKPGGRTGAATTTFTGIPGGSLARYTKTAAQFGGPAVTKVVAVTPIRVWANPGAMLPCKHPAFGGANASCVAPLLAAYPASMVAAGGAAGNVQATPGTPSPMTPGVVALSVPGTTGIVAKSISIAMSAMVTNAATSVGFPWTTGMITLSQPAALGSVEVFTITGMDSRKAGAGTISLVSGALSNRKITGPNANRAWARFTLPEPSAEIGAAVALAMLWLCHALVRRRER